MKPVLLCLFYLCLFYNISNSQIIWDYDNPIDVAESSYGNFCPRLVLDSFGNPKVFFGKVGIGLFVANGVGDTFDLPLLIPNTENIFLSNTNGPDISINGESIGIVYKSSDQENTSIKYQKSNDLGYSWDNPVEIFEGKNMSLSIPMFDFDDLGNPFIFLKVGEYPNVMEGFIKSNDEGETFLPFSNSNINVGSGISCECCPSNPFYYNNRFYNIYRRNENNIRDFWLISSVDGQLWDEQIDIDFNDWFIQGCPSSGASTSILSENQIASVFMSSQNSNQRIYINLFNPTDTENISTYMLIPDQFQEANQNHPNISSNYSHSAVVWEEFDNGFQVKLTILLNESIYDGFTNSIYNLSENIMGSNRYPEVRIFNDKIHVIWQNSLDGTIKYLKGTITNTSQIIQESTFESKKLIKVINALGQEVCQTNNQILFFVYDDGSIQKKIIID